MNTDVMFSSAKDDWETPDDLFAELHREFRFTLDVCATVENTKLPRFITPEQDALHRGRPWGKRCWMNPPYGRSIYDWVSRARKQGLGALVCCLLPARTDTRWWHDFIWDVDKHRPREGVEVRFLKGRLKFKSAKHAAPFPSCVVIFR